jgi:predicted neuraminidase
MSRITAHRVLPVLIVLACATSAYKLSHRPPPAGFQMPSIAATNGTAVMTTRFVSRQQQISTHASSLIELNDGRVRAFWFAGSREGAEDVEIRSAVFDGKQWSEERGVIDREHTQQALLRYVKKLGNPVAARAPDGAIWLYYVTVSLGGWAGSSLTTMTSRDEGATWSAPRRLVTSPFINISTLIKGTPFAYSDGPLGLPVYHAFLGNFGELLHLSRNGDILDKQRLSKGKAGIQPVMLIENPNLALVLMRYTGAPTMRVLATQTRDGGQTWSAPVKTDLPNPDAALSGVVLNDGRMLVVANDLEQGRDALSLLVSRDHGTTWRKVYSLEDQRGQSTVPGDFLRNSAQLALASDAHIANANAYAKSAQRNRCEADHCGYEFSYPYLIQTRNGDFHLVYTWNRSFIKHVQFNRAWLDARMKESDAALH